MTALRKPRLDESHAIAAQYPAPIYDQDEVGLSPTCWRWALGLSAVIWSAMLGTCWLVAVWVGP